jgi:hypothetical protein
MDHATHPSSADRRLAIVYWCAMAVCIFVCLAPIWLIEYLPLVDYSNHLGGTRVKHEWDHSQFFQHYFVKGSSLIPNQAMEIPIPPSLDYAGVVSQEFDYVFAIRLRPDDLRKLNDRFQLVAEDGMMRLCKSPR